MKYAVVTFGCRVNQADSLAIEDALLTRGAERSDAAHADLVVVNTCSVTATADQGARQVIRRIARENPAVQIVVTGCYASRRPDELRDLPNVTRVVGNMDKDNVLRDVELTTGERYGGGDGPCGALGPGVAGRTALTIRVQTGCEESCSYCIIPTTRGASRSRPLAAVLPEIQRAVAAGYKEIVVTGVHLGSYGRDLDDGTSLLSLVAALADWPGDVLFRISSLEPMDCGPAIVELVAQSPRLAPHLHLPLQHGCDGMLRAMRRPYTSRFYRELVTDIRRRLPHASIGSDVIVGFPGETDEQFAESAALIRELPLTHLHVFPYSDRPGTEASRMTGKVAGTTIRERGRVMREIGARMAAGFRASQTGTTRRALTVDDGTAAVTDNYLKVRLSEPRTRNEWVDVTVA